MVKIVPKRLEKDGHVRTDNYHWLKERENPEVIDFLKKENEYTKASMAHTEALEKTIFQEIKGRIKQTDMSVPYQLDDYFYYTRYEDGKEYPIYCRKKGSLNGPEEIMLDANALAKGHEFLSVDARAVSFGQDILAYSVDTIGRRFYTIHFKDLNTGEVLKDVITNVTGNMDWANDNRTLFYSRQDPTTLRSYQIYRHVLGTESSEDQLVYDCLRGDGRHFFTICFQNQIKKVHDDWLLPDSQPRIPLSGCRQPEWGLQGLFITGERTRIPG
jgi:oligopeptidase B